jgi:glucose/arabinose dehydrogenase
MMFSLLNAILEFTLRALLQSESGRCFSSITLVAIICLPTLQAVEPQRHAWNESKVIGFPDPPAPFEVVPLHPHLDIAKPMGVTALPGTKDLLVHAHKGGYGGPGRLLRITPADAASHDTESELEEFLVLDDIIYGVTFHPDFEKNGWMYVGCNGKSDALDQVCTACCDSISNVKHHFNAILHHR